MSRHCPRVVVIDGHATTIRAFADNAGLTYEAVRKRMEVRTPEVGEDGVPRYTSEALLTDGRETASRISGMKRRNHALRARIAELLTTPDAHGRLPTKADVARMAGISRTRLYQILGSR